MLHPLKGANVTIHKLLFAYTDIPKLHTWSAQERVSGRTSWVLFFELLKNRAGPVGTNTWWQVHVLIGSYLIQ
jgi:hypothetical protein